MSNKFLPIHPRLTNSMLIQADVLHCGDNMKFCGRNGVVTAVGAGYLAIQWEGRTDSMTYSREWALNNIRVSLSDLRRLRGNFQGAGYVKKYESHAVLSGRLYYNPLNHSILKLLLEPEPKVAAKRDQKDEVGNYVTVKKSGGLIANHKTLRIAELAAVAHTERYQETVLIYKEVACTSPVVTCKAEVKYT